MISGAIDLSGPFGACAVATDGRVIVDAARPMRGRESAQLAPWIAGLLTEQGLKIADVERWTIGSGPGSFTGMRLAAALVSGWSYARPGVHGRCVPTALIPASASGAAEGESVGVLFDGRNAEMLVFEVRRAGGQWRPAGFSAVWNAEEARAGLGRFDRLAAFDYDRAALTALLGEAALAPVAFYPGASARPLLDSDAPFDDVLTDLVYIRPAVFTKPVA